LDRIADLSGFVREATAGDEGAFRVLYQQVQPGLLRYLTGIVDVDAEDVAAETWLQIARDIRSYREQGGGFRAWAVSIARNRAIDLVRQRRRRPTLAVATESFADRTSGDDTEEQAMEGVAMRTAIAWIATLPPDQAEAVLLRVVVGLDAESAARVLGKRPGAVRTAAHRGLRRLAERLDADPTEAPPLPEAQRTRGRSAGVTQIRSSTLRDSR
jgi:RNA polymerase sigma-70 factor, ECF subfamily